MGGRYDRRQPDSRGLPSVTPYLTIKGAAAAIDFYTEVLGASEGCGRRGPDGTIAPRRNPDRQLSDHARRRAPRLGALVPKTVGGTPVRSTSTSRTSTRVHRRAIEAGASELRAARRPVLRRPLGPVRGPIRPPLECGITHQDVSGDAETDGRGRRKLGFGQGRLGRPLRSSQARPPRPIASRTPHRPGSRAAS